jgi:hypothetical protein
MPKDSGVAGPGSRKEHRSPTTPFKPGAQPGMGLSGVSGILSGEA